MALRKGRKPQKSAQAPSSNSRSANRPVRRAKGGLWLYGVHAALGALNNPARTIERLVVNPDAAQRWGSELDAATRTRRLRPEAMDQRAIAAELPARAVHQGIAVLTKPLPNPHIEDVCTIGNPGRHVVLVLDQVTDPQNFGAILRSAGAFGAQAVVSTQRHAPPESGALAKAASGALETVPVVRVPNLARSLETLADLGYWRTGLTAAGTDPLAARENRAAVALVLGAEGKGMRRLTLEHCDSLERIAGAGGLNVSVAAAVALYALTIGEKDPGR